MPARSFRVCTSVKPAACRSAASASAWPSPISSASTPAGASSAGASATRRRTRSSPSAPPSSASAGSAADVGGQRRELARRDVGQVGDDQRERRVRDQRRAQIALDEGDRRAQPFGVRARHLQRPRRDVAGEHGGVGAHLRQRDGQRARAGADVGDASGRARPARRVAPAPPRSASRCRGGAPARARRRELELPELLAPGQVRDGFARLAPLDQVAQARPAPRASARARTARRAAGAAATGRARPAAPHRGAASPARARQTARWSSAPRPARSRSRAATTSSGAERPKRDAILSRLTSFAGVRPERRRSGGRRRISRTSSTFTPPYQTCSG